MIACHDCRPRDLSTRRAAEHGIPRFPRQGKVRAPLHTLLLRDEFAADAMRRWASGLVGQRFAEEDFAGAAPDSAPCFPVTPGAPPAELPSWFLGCLRTAASGTAVLPAAGPDVTPGEDEESPPVAACAIGA
jgi:hypothetical protein